MSKIKVVDVETSGLRSNDIVYQIGISEVDTEKKTVEPIYDKVIGYDISEFNSNKKNAWIFDNSDLKLEDIDEAYKKGDTAEKIGKEVNELLLDQKVAIYNVGFDFPFLRKQSFGISRKNCTILPCLMLYSTDVCKIPQSWRQGYKWPTLDEAYHIIVDNKIRKNLDINWHSASADTIAAGYVLLELIDKYNYKI